MGCERLPAVEVNLKKNNIQVKAKWYGIKQKTFRSDKYIESAKYYTRNDGGRPYPPNR